jgi:Domain of unknown function (DUF4351)
MKLANGTNGATMAVMTSPSSHDAASLDPPENSVAADWDGPWKEALDAYLQGMTELCFPDVAAAVDWSQAPVPLDQELQEIVRDAEAGKLRADKLYRVVMRDGTLSVVLLHVEVQGQTGADFEKRMYNYQHRLEDRFGLRVISLALLIDGTASWRPQGVYHWSLMGCSLTFRFPVCKLLTFRRKIRQLEQSSNPAAFIILAQLRALQTRGASKSRQRLLFKWALARRLYESGQAKQDVLDLFRLIDWLITLPKNLDLEFRHRQVTYTQENTMPYITSTERLAREEGLEAGREEASSRIVLRLLKRRFELDDGDVADVKSLTVEQAMDLSEEQMDFTSVNDLRIWLAVKRK